MRRRSKREERDEAAPELAAPAFDLSLSKHSFGLRTRGLLLLAKGHLPSPLVPDTAPASLAHNVDVVPNVEVPPLETLSLFPFGLATTTEPHPRSERASISPLPAVVLHVANALFRDDPAIWPPGGTRFYLGLLPPVALLSLEQDSQRRLVARVLAAWHLSCVRLAGRIWGSYLRRVRPSLSQRTQLRDSDLPLPVHIAHLRRFCVSPS